MRHGPCPEPARTIFLWVNGMMILGLIFLFVKQYF